LLLSHCYDTSMRTCNSCYSSSSSLLLSLIIMIMSLLTTISSSSSYESAPRTVQQAHGYDIADTAKCYSCMSKFYEAVWPLLSSVYKRPKNFTDLCNDNIEHSTKSIPLVDCPTICVKMSEESNVAGIRILGHIRGCLDDVLHSGFNQTIVTWYRWMHRDSCRPYKKRELMKLPQSDDSFVNVCTCYADYCNGSVNRNNAKLFSDNLLLRWIILLGLLSINAALR